MLLILFLYWIFTNNFLQITVLIELKIFSHISFAVVQIMCNNCFKYDKTSFKLKAYFIMLK